LCIFTHKFCPVISHVNVELKPAFQISLQSLNLLIETEETFETLVIVQHWHKLFVRKILVQLFTVNASNITYYTYIFNHYYLHLLVQNTLKLSEFTK
jgi:hypothetical protein